MQPGSIVRTTMAHFFFFSFATILMKSWEDDCSFFFFLLFWFSFTSHPTAVHQHRGAGGVRLYCLIHGDFVSITMHMASGRGRQDEELARVGGNKNLGGWRRIKFCFLFKSIPRYLKGKTYGFRVGAFFSVLSSCIASSSLSLFSFVTQSAREWLSNASIGIVSIHENLLYNLHIEFCLWRRS